MTDYMRNIRQLREENGKTRQEIAELLGIPEKKYARFEDGKIDLNTNHLIILCHYYKVSADWIFGVGEFADQNNEA